MSAVPHLLQRVKRWAQSHMLRTRIAQLSELIDRIENGIMEDHDEVTALRLELARDRQRLRFLTNAYHGEKTPCV